MKHTRAILPTDPVTYVPGFLPPAISAAIFKSLRDELEWERREFAPRSEYWTNTLDRPYTYGSGIGQRTYEPKVGHFYIRGIAGLLRPYYEGRGFEGCFLNLYEGERDALGWHADDDPGIDHTRPIAVVTVGAGRALQFREKPKDGEPSDIVEVFLGPGSLLLMHAGMQDTHLHRIPKVGHHVGPRISLTYRGLVA